MSLSRLALRLAATEALNPSALAASGPWPTIAGANVFEERIDAIAQAETAEDLQNALAGLEGKPVVIVYTEDHHSLPYGSVKYPPDENVVTLTIEISLGAHGAVQAVDAAGNAEVFGADTVPITDRVHAALLDLLESQIRYIFDSRNRAPSNRLMHLVAGEIRSIHSDPQRAADRTLRLALRTIKFHIKVKGESWPQAGSAPAVGLERLPSPLREVAAGLPDDSSGRELCLKFANSMPAPSDLPVGPLGISLYGGMGRLPSEPVGVTDSDADLRAKV